MPLATIEWIGDLSGRARLIDQTLLPAELKYIECEDAETMWHAIKRLAVRGAPAIGIAGALGTVLGVRASNADTADEFLKDLKRVTDYLASSRPTAVNLFWALDRLNAAARRNAALPVQKIKQSLLDEALRIIDEDKTV